MKADPSYEEVDKAERKTSSCISIKTLGGLYRNASYENACAIKMKTADSLILKCCVTGNTGCVLAKLEGWNVSTVLISTIHWFHQISLDMLLFKRFNFVLNIETGTVASPFLGVSHVNKTKPFVVLRFTFMYVFFLLFAVNLTCFCIFYVTHMFICKTIYVVGVSQLIWW